MKRFQNILSGVATQEEREAFFRELEKNPALKEEFLNVKNLWHLSKISGQKISLHRKQKLFDEFWESTAKNQVRKINWLQNVWKYAAIFVIALLSGVLLQKLAPEAGRGEPIVEYTYHSEKGSLSSVVLPDGSKIWLNSDTRLEIAETRGEVNARLTGEAYFEIKHDEEREFIVDLGAIKVKDLGTRFNIRAYPEDETIRTILMEGDIDVLDLENHSVARIDPGEGAIYNKSTRIMQVKNVDTSIESAWKEGKFVFIDQTLQQICSNLEKWYNVKFVITDKTLAETKYTCVLKRTTTVGQVLEILKAVSAIEYQVEEVKGDVDKIIIN